MAARSAISAFTFIIGLVLIPVLLLAFVADIRGCVCDPAHPDTMQGRECGLTEAAVKDLDSAPVFFVKDANPTKPNRWLAIPHALHHTLDDMTPAERNAYWSAAIEKARSLWQDSWAIAVNSDERRTQCQLHAHIGKLLDTTDRTGGILVDKVEEIPVPPPGTGIWIHPEGSKLRVHPGQSAPETGLMR
jgi:hypothetical protein